MTVIAGFLGIHYRMVSYAVDKQKVQVSQFQIPYLVTPYLARGGCGGHRPNGLRITLGRAEDC